MKNVKKIGCVVLMVATMCMSLTGCGKKTLSGEYVVSEMSEAAPSIFPQGYINEFFKYENCEMEFLSDGTLLMDATEEGKTPFAGKNHKFACVDGKLKIVAPLGSTAVSDYVVSGSKITISDDKGNYIVLTKK